MYLRKLADSQRSPWVVSLWPLTDSRVFALGGLRTDDRVTPQLPGVFQPADHTGAGLGASVLVLCVRFLPVFLDERFDGRPTVLHAF